MDIWKLELWNNWKSQKPTVMVQESLTSTQTVGFWDLIGVGIVQNWNESPGKENCNGESMENLICHIFTMKVMPGGGAGITA